MNVAKFKGQPKGSVGIELVPLAKGLQPGGLDCIHRVRQPTIQRRGQSMVLRRMTPIKIRVALKDGLHANRRLGAEFSLQQASIRSSSGLSVPGYSDFGTVRRDVAD